MKTTITINHATREDLNHALGLVRNELTQGYLQSSGRVPAKVPMKVSVAPSIYPPGFPGQPMPTVEPYGCRCSEEVEKEEELPPTSYTYEIVE